MHLDLIRNVFTDKSTIGKLYINKEFECITLEDTLRDTKVYGQTAIPEGVYLVIIDYSPRFEKDLPRILNVPSFEGIRIHTGNKPEDTHGCILVGTSVGKDYIYNSVLAFNSLMVKLVKAYKNKDPIYIKITSVQK